MEIKFTTKQILKVLQILSWVIFVGLCIEAGGIVVTTIITLFINPAAVKNSWDWSGYLSSLSNVNQGHFIVIAVIMIIVAVLKAIMFYFIVKLFAEKTLNISQPFSSKLRHFILMLSYLALGIGLFSLYGSNYTAWLTSQGAKTADLQALRIGGADVWLFMAVILFVIVQIVKRGIEIQTENDLTI